MYIPIGPSKKDLYKIIIGLLLVVYLIFLGMYKPKALVIDYNTNPTQTNVTGSFTLWHVLGDNLFYNQGQGKIVYQFLATGQMNINSISVKYHQSSRNNSVCQFGSVSNFNDNNNQQVFYSIICDVDLTNAGIDELEIEGYAWQTCKIDLSKHLQFTDIGSGVSANDMANIIATNSYYTQQVIIDKANEIKNAINNNNTTINNIQNNTSDINNNLNDSSIDSSSANDLTSNSAFQDSNGLDAIIKAPLNFIQSLTSSTCSAINLTIPYIDADVSLPCMSSIYTKALGQQLVNLIALVINGVVLYRYCLKILQLVHDAKNPNKDVLEVLDL